MKKTASLILLLLIAAATASAQTLDTYYGVIETPCPNQAPTDWNMQKLATGRWVFCTPLGHAYIKRGVWYIVGDDHTDATYVPMSFNVTTNAKYPTNDAIWDQAYARIKGWGYNSGAPGDFRHATYGGVQAANKLPFTEYLEAANNVHEHFITSNVGKNIWNLKWPPNYPYDSSVNHNITDVYDSNYVSYVNAAYAADNNIASFKNSPYYIGAVTADTDLVSGFGAGVAFPTDPPGSEWEHNSLWILMSGPHATLNQRNSNSIYANVTNNTKTAMQTFLTTRYGTIGNLNTAWGSTYTTFGTSGTQVVGSPLSGSGNGPWTITGHANTDRYSVKIYKNGTAIGGDDGSGTIRGSGVSSGTVNYSTGAISVTFSSSATTSTVDFWWGGYGVGTGLLDEWGVHASHAWFPANLFTMDVSTSAFKVDMDDFLEQYAIVFFRVMRNAFKAQAPTKLFFGISNLGHVPGRSPTRCPIIKAAGGSDGGGPYVDVPILSTSGSQAQVTFITNCLGDRPYEIWYTVSANADSDWYAKSPGQLGTWNKTTQGARATQFSTDMDNMWNTSLRWVGYDHWAYDEVSFFEFINFGLVSWRDNAYDGHEDVQAGVSCSPPINALACGHEQAGWSAYGNFLGPVTTRNHAIDVALLAVPGTGKIIVISGNLKLTGKVQVP